MYKITIRVIKACLNAEMQKYAGTDLEKCPVFTEGQTFETEYEKPRGFCDWAWNDIRPYVASLLTGGNFSDGMFRGWMKDEGTMIACCTDGIRPVVFEIRRVEE